MDEDDELVLAIRETHAALRFEFIITELDLAITFCQIANCTGNEQTATRNIENARRAYAAAEKSSLGTDFNSELTHEIEQRAVHAPYLLRNFR